MQYVHLYDHNRTCKCACVCVCVCYTDAASEELESHLSGTICLSNGNDRATEPNQSKV